MVLRLLVVRHHKFSLQSFFLNLLSTGLSLINVGQTYKVFFFYSPALHKWLLLYLNHEVSITQEERVDKKFWSWILQDIRLYHSNVHGGSKIFLKEGTILPPFPWIFFYEADSNKRPQIIFIYLFFNCILFYTSDYHLIFIRVMV